MAYPYPPLPYSAALWTATQDAQYRTNLQLPPTRPAVIPTYTGHSSTENALVGVLPSRTKFSGWAGFDEKVQQARTDSMALIGSFSNDEMWTFLAGFTTGYQDLVGSSNVTSEADVSVIMKNAASSVAEIYNYLDTQQTIAKVAQRACLETTIFRYGGSPLIDLVFFRSPHCTGDAGHARDRLVAVEIKRPSIPLTSDGVLSNSASSVASKHNSGYSDDDDNRGKVWYLRMMSQALTYAMHTKNGCVMLTNHNRAMFMKVEPHVSAEGWKLDVKVSRQYKCNGTYSSYHGIIAILRESVNGSDNTDNLQNAFNSMQDARRPRTRSRNVGSAARTSQRVRRSKASGSGTRGSSATSTVGTSRSSQDGDRARPKAQSHSSVDRFYQPELICHLMETSKDIIAMDGHSTVARSRDGDMEVVVKYWNCAGQEGLDMILNEIQLYEEVAAKHPHLLGTVLPRLVALWKEPRTDAVVVTEHVGESLTRQEDGIGRGATSLRVGNTVLDSDDYELLQDAAFKALNELHSTGLRHRDVDVRNMRARRVVDEDGAVTWRVWFIDLGLARFSWDEDDAVNDVHALRSACRRELAT